MFDDILGKQIKKMTFDEIYDKWSPPEIGNILNVNDTVMCEIFDGYTDMGTPIFQMTIGVIEKIIDGHFINIVCGTNNTKYTVNHMCIRKVFDMINKVGRDYKNYRAYDHTTNRFIPSFEEMLEIAKNNNSNG